MQESLQLQKAVLKCSSLCKNCNKQFMRVMLVTMPRRLNSNLQQEEAEGDVERRCLIALIWWKTSRRERIEKINVRASRDSQSQKAQNLQLRFYVISFNNVSCNNVKFYIMYSILSSTYKTFFHFYFLLHIHMLISSKNHINWTIYGLGFLQMNMLIGKELVKEIGLVEFQLTWKITYSWKWWLGMNTRGGGVEGIPGWCLGGPILDGNMSREAMNPC